MNTITNTIDKIDSLIREGKGNDVIRAIARTLAWGVGSMYFQPRYVARLLKPFVENGFILDQKVIEENDDEVKDLIAVLKLCGYGNLAALLKDEAGLYK